METFEKVKEVDVFVWNRLHNEKIELIEKKRKEKPYWFEINQ